MAAESFLVVVGVYMTMMGLSALAISSFSSQAVAVPSNRRRAATMVGLAEPKS